MALLAVLLFAALSAEAQGASGEVSAAQVDAAIAGGLQYLYSVQAANGSWETAHARRYRGLAEAAVVLAALEAGEGLDKAPVKAAVVYLVGLDPRTVQVRAARARVYARLPQSEYGDRLQADAAWLVKQQQKSGGWGYGLDNPTPRADWTDATNSAAAVLALHEASDAGVNVSPTVWRSARTWWTKLQNRDGGWGFDPPGSPSEPALRGDSYGSTTAAALVSLHVIQLRLAGENPTVPRPPRRPNPAPEADRKALADGREWLESRYSLARIPRYPQGLGEDYLGQYQAAVQQAGRLSGWHDMAGRVVNRELAAALVGQQQRSGLWHDATVTAEGGGQPGVGILPTALAVQCLARARQSEAVGWLAVGTEFDPCAVENVSRAVGRSLKQPVTWRRVTAEDVARSGLPVVLMTWDGAAPFEGKLAGALRRYIEAGGFVLVQPLGGDKKFAQQARDFMTRTSSGLTPTLVGADHPLMTIGALPSNFKPAVTGLRDFTGLRAIVLEEDLTGAWHIGRRMESAALLANVLRYVHDSGALPSPFSSSAAPADSAGKMAGEIVVARVKLGDAWAGFPNAAGRVGEALTSAMSLGVRQADAVDLTHAVPTEIDLLWLPAAGNLTLDAQQRQVLANYLRGGGTLFVDSAVGEEQAFQAGLELAQSLCGKENVRELPADHAVITGQLAGGSGADVTKPAWTAVVQNARRKPNRLLLHGGIIDGKLRVIVSPMAATGPAAGPTLHGCRGLATPDARRLLCNVLLHAAGNE